MDFVKKAAESLGNKSDDKSKDSSSSGNDSKSEGKYDKYIDKAVDYGEEKFMGTDVKNKSESVKKRDEQIGV